LLATGKGLIPCFSGKEGVEEPREGGQQFREEKAIHDGSLAKRGGAIGKKKRDPAMWEKGKGGKNASNREGGGIPREKKKKTLFIRPKRRKAGRENGRR